MCRAAGAHHVACIDLKFERGNLPPKWDLADALPEGVTLDDIRGKVTEVIAAFKAPPEIINAVPVAKSESPFKASPSGATAGISNDKEVEFDMD